MEMKTNSHCPTKWGVKYEPRAFDQQFTDYPQILYCGSHFYNVTYAK